MLFGFRHKLRTAVFALCFLAVAPAWAGRANFCEWLLLTPAWRELDLARLGGRNPFFSRSMRGIFERQAVGLRIIAENEHAPSELRALARRNLEYFKNARPTPELELRLQALEPLARLQSALEFVSVTFRTPGIDTDFIKLAIRQLGRSPASDEHTIALLLPLARGVELPALMHARLANEAIREIAERHHASYPARARANEPRTEAMDLLLHEPVAKVEPLGGGANTTLLVTFENGRRAVFKPMAGEMGYPRDDRSTDWILFNREVSAYDIVELWLGHATTVPAFVPTTAEVVLYHDGRSYGAGSLQLFEEGFEPLEKFIARAPAEWERVRASELWGQAEAWVRTIDYLLGNYDRFPNSKHRQGNLGNLLIRVESDGRFRVALIDNGIGRKSMLPGEFGIEDCPVRDHIPRELKEAVLRLDTQAFHNYYLDRLPAAGIQDFLGRLAALRRRIEQGP